MTHNAKVMHTCEDGTAEVVVRRSSACGHSCVNCNGCMANPEAIVVIAENPIHARAGDDVMLESSSGKILWIATLVYIVPFLLFFIGYIAAALLGLENLWEILLGTAGFLLGIGLNLLQNRRMRNRSLISYRIVDLVN